MAKAAPALFERLGAALKTSEGDELKSKVKVSPHSAVSCLAMVPGVVSRKALTLH